MNDENVGASSGASSGKLFPSETAHETLPRPNICWYPSHTFTPPDIEITNRDNDEYNGKNQMFHGTRSKRALAKSEGPRLYWPIQHAGTSSTQKQLAPSHMERLHLDFGSKIAYWSNKERNAKVALSSGQG